MTAPRGPSSPGQWPGRDPVRDRVALSRGQRVATGIVGLALVLLGFAGMLASRLSGDRPGSVSPIALFVAGFGVSLLVVAARGRSFGWLPTRDPALLPQMVLAVGVVTLVAIGRGIAAVRTDLLGRTIGWGSIALGIALVVIAVMRRWVPRIGDRRRDS